MANPFYETRLELGANYGAAFGPRFSTAICRQSNGQEQRRILWEQPLVMAQLGSRSVTLAELNYLLSFHEAVKGAYIGFRIKDWSDYKATNQVLGTGNGTSQTWQLVKRYTVGAVTVTRPITKPVAGTLKVFVDGLEVLEDFSLDTTTGTLTTTLTGVISVSFEFDVPVRFEEDKIQFTFKAVGAGTRCFELAALTCTEVRIPLFSDLPLDPIPAELGETLALGYDLETQGGPQFQTQIQMTGAEFEDRKSFWDNPLGAWNIGNRTLLRSEVEYYVSVFRCTRGMAVPFNFLDWQTGATKRVRFDEDRISLTFEAWRRSDDEVGFTLGGLSAREVPSELSPPLNVFNYTITISADAYGFVPNFQTITRTGSTISVSFYQYGPDITNGWFYWGLSIIIDGGESLPSGVFYTISLADQKVYKNDGYGILNPVANVSAIPV